MVSTATAAPATIMKWIAPALLWNAPGTTLQQPFLAEFTEDSFMSDFLNMLAGTGDTTGTLTKPHDTVAAYQPDTIYKLYQPIHKRFYLVTASLVCRQFGMPDRTIDRKNGEKISFVLRRLMKVIHQDGTTDIVEAGWVNSGPTLGWHPVMDKLKRFIPSSTVLKDEERLPLHPAKYCPFTPALVPPAGTAPVQKAKPCEPRTVYHGYIPVDKREKYLDPAKPTAIQQNIGASGVDPRLDQITTKVIDTWRALYEDPTTKDPLTDGQNLLYENVSGLSAAEQARRQKLRNQMSLYLILDLADILNIYLPGIFKAIMGTGPIPATGTRQKVLFDELNSIVINTNAGTIKLTDAIIQLQNSANLARAESEPPADTYDVAYALVGGVRIDQHYNDYLKLPDAPTQPIPPAPPMPAPGIPLTGEGLFHQLFRESLAAGGAALQIPTDVVKMIKDERVNGDVYFVRLVYERGECDPIVSEQSIPFTFAKVFDPDAPARPIRIEMPSIRLKDLRKYRRGIGFQMPSELNDLLNRVNPGMLKGGGLADAGAPLGIAMICTFSIPIITICALIVLFIFLILLNIIFWWLPFIMICFPVPKPRSGP